MKLRTLLKYTAVAAICCTAPSCHGDLDIMQDNKLSASNMWKTSEDVLSSTYGIYERPAKIRKPQCTVVHVDFRIKRNAGVPF